MHAAIAVEMIHTYSLIHDDLPCMDNDDLRRGQPTNHKVHGEATALLAGDALIGLANDVLLQSAPLIHQLTESNEEAFARTLLSVQVLNTALGCRGIIQGQSLELSLVKSPQIEEILSVFRYKTGALFEACLLIPAYWAGHKRSDPLFQHLRDYAYAYGVLFQIADDYEDSEILPHSIRRFPDETLKALIQKLILKLEEIHEEISSLKPITTDLLHKLKQSHLSSS
jgi:geranylgeranyl diphosphate synthase type II